jgi:hypothetical protein
MRQVRPPRSKVARSLGPEAPGVDRGEAYTLYPFLGVRPDPWRKPPAKEWEQVEMRYRMEVVGDYELAVRNVETDIRTGTAYPHYAVDTRFPDHPPIFVCDVVNNNLERLAMISSATVPSPIKMASVAVANYEAHFGYPDFLGQITPVPDIYRIENRLGTLLADTVSAIAGTLIKRSNGGLKPQTKEKCAELIAQLHRIWYASRFGSFDGERRVHDPYFVNTPPSDPRMGFAEAAQHYGLLELQRRFPDQSDPTLKEMLSWPLDLLRNLVDRVSPLDVKRLNTIASQLL